MKKLHLIIILTASLALSACTSVSNSNPSTYIEPTGLPQISKEVTTPSPTVTDDQMSDDLNNDIDFNLDQEFSKLESELQQITD